MRGTRIQVLVEHGNITGEHTTRRARLALRSNTAEALRTLA